MDKTVLDIDDVLERVQDDWELLFELFTIFEGDYEQKRAALDDLIKAGDLEQIKNLAHSMKGASGNISAKAVHQTCAQMELFAEQNNVREIERLLKTLDQQYAQLQKCINELRQKKDNPRA